MMWCWYVLIENTRAKHSFVDGLEGEWWCGHFPYRTAGKLLLRLSLLLLWYDVMWFTCWCRCCLLSSNHRLGFASEYVDLDRRRFWDIWSKVSEWKILFSNCQSLSSGGLRESDLMCGKPDLTGGDCGTKWSKQMWLYAVLCHCQYSVLLVLS